MHRIFKPACVMNLLVVALTVPALADPPAHAPAHGWRAKNDPYYPGYTGKRWQQDYGIVSGHCDREAIATVLGGIVGGVIGSKVGDGENRKVAIIIGAAAGALIGRRIGRELDDADRSCFGHALEVGKPGIAVSWSNETTGVHYEMLPGAANHDYDGSCRNYSLKATAGDRVSSRQGVACQAEPGTWNVVKVANR